MAKDKDSEFAAFDSAVEDFSAFDDAVKGQEQPGYVESGLRGAAQGASFGFADELTGALESLLTEKTYEQARDESRQAYDLASEANPLTSIGGNLVGGIGTALIPGVGALGKAAQGANALARAGSAAKLGAGAGAIAGLGTSEADLTKGELGEAALDVGTGAVTGGITGGLLQGGLDASKGVPALLKGAKAEALDIPFIQNLSRAYQTELGGIKLTGDKAFNAAYENLFEQANKLALASKNTAEKFPKAIDKVIKRAQASGVKIDLKEKLSPVREKLVRLMEETKDAGIKDDLQKSLSFIDNHLNEEQQVSQLVSKLKPSAKAQLLNTQAIEAEKSRLLGENAQFNIQPSPDNSLISLIKTLDEAVEAPERVITKNVKLPKDIQKLTGEKTKKVEIFDKGDAADIFNSKASVLKTLDNTPEQQVIEELLSKITKETPLKTPKQALAAKREISSMVVPGEKSAFKTTIGEKSGRDILGALKTFEAEIPGLQEVNKKSSSALKAMELLGVTKDDFIETVDELGRKKLVLDPVTAKNIANKLRQSATDQTTAQGAKELFKQTLSQLEQASPEIANKLKPGIEQAAERVDLARAVRGEGLGKANILGTTTGLGLRGAALVGRATRSIKEATPDYIKNIASDVVNKGSKGAKLAKVLSEAVNRDDVGRNALLFALNQNPEYREMLKDYFKD